MFTTVVREAPGFAGNPAGFFGLSPKLYLTIMVPILDSNTIAVPKMHPGVPALAPCPHQAYGYHSCQCGDTGSSAV